MVAYLGERAMIRRYAAFALAVLAATGLACVSPALATDPPTPAALQAACNQGNARACFDLGDRHERGIGVAKDEVRAVPFLARACDLKIGDACYRAGTLLDSASAAPDLPRAFQLYRKGCDLNSANGCFSLGFAYRLGKGVARNEALGASLMDKGCDMGSSGCKFLKERGLLPLRAAAPPARGIANSGVNFGASIATVRQSLAGRTLELLPARHNGNWYRLVAGGNFSDIDPRLVRLTYEFDATEGPAAKLIGVVLTYARDNAAESTVYSERASTLAKQYPLAPLSQTKMEATVAGTVVSVIDDATFGQVYELYRKAGAFPATISNAAAGKVNCQTVNVKASAIRKGNETVTFTASPVIDGLAYSWTVSAGTIESGQGTPTIMLSAHLPARTKVTATVELAASPSCPARVASATATMP
jgi:hypothetical protein